jgi:hypothetical protein
MKSITEITIADLEAHSVWIFCNAPKSDDVTPYVKKGPIPVSAWIRTRFVANDGTEYDGFAMHTKISLVTPIIVTPKGQVPLYLGDGKPSDAALSELYGRLASAPERLFPVRFSATVKTRNPLGEDVVRGFVYRDQDGAFHEMRPGT